MLKRPHLIITAVLALLVLAPIAAADHIPGRPCSGCASHEHWPRITGKIKVSKGKGSRVIGTRRSDELLGQHTSDRLHGRSGSDVLWGDSIPRTQPARQRDRIYGGNGRDFIYGSHGFNRIFGGRGNDAISVHFGRGVVDCGPGRDIYHVARSRRHRYKFRNCERVDYRSEHQRGGGLRPLR